MTALRIFVGVEWVTQGEGGMVTTNNHTHWEAHAGPGIVKE